MRKKEGKNVYEEELSGRKVGMVVSKQKKFFFCWVIFDSEKALCNSIIRKNKACVCCHR